MLGPAPTPSLLEQNADRVAPTTWVTAKQQPGATRFTSTPTLDGGTPPHHPLTAFVPGAMVTKTAEQALK